jgi:hypothetical protein
MKLDFFLHKTGKEVRNLVSKQKRFQLCQSKPFLFDGLFLFVIRNLHS